MANVKTTNVGIQDSIHLYLLHWKYGHNYEDSTVLKDGKDNIIAFFDRKTENIDVILADLPHPGGFIIGDGVGYEIDSFVKYEPYDYEMARRKWKERCKELRSEGKSTKGLWDEMLQDLKDYNINYFDNVKNSIIALGGTEYSVISEL